MARRRSQDWDGLVQEYAKTKVSEPLLTHMDFFKRKGINPALAYKRIGVRMTQEWEKVRNEAARISRKDNAIDLSAEMAQLFRTNKNLISVGAATIFGSKKDPKAKKLPENFKDGVAAIQAGSRALIQVGELFSGGQPILPPSSGVKRVFQWNRPLGRAKPTKRAKKSVDAGDADEAE
jgi:hypothetical protein